MPIEIVLEGESEPAIGATELLASRSVDFLHMRPQTFLVVVKLGAYRALDALLRAELVNASNMLPIGARVTEGLAAELARDRFRF